MRSLTNGKGLSLLLMLAGLALWMLLAGPGRLFGISTGQLGIVVLLAGTWALLYAVSRIPRDALDAAASPAEWKARIGTVFCLVAVVYFLANAHVFNDAPMRQNPEAAAVGRHLALLLGAWAILSSIVASRWKGAVETDERDREIAIHAAGWGRGALIACIIGFAVLLAYTPVDRLEWATPPMIGNLLIFALMWGWLCEYVATLALYRRDRAQTA